MSSNHFEDAGGHQVMEPRLSSFAWVNGEETVRSTTISSGARDV